jgi:hypothetical protein
MPEGTARPPEADLAGAARHFRHGGGDAHLVLLGKPEQADTWRARWRTSTTSCSLDRPTFRMRWLLMRLPLAARHQHHGVVAAADEVAHQHGRDERRGAHGQAR